MKWRGVVAIGVFALALAGAARAEEAPPVHLCISGGGDVVLSGETGAALTPAAYIAVRGPIVFGGTKDGQGKAALDFGVDLQLSGLPGETVDASAVESIKALELAVRVGRTVGRLGDGVGAVRTALFLEAGFASRLPHDPAPRDHYPRWFGGAVRLSSGENFIQGGLAADQRLDGEYQLAALVSGQVALPKDLKGVTVALRGSAILGLQQYPGVASARDVVRIGLVVLGR